ncbi:MAG: DUF4811 domain-containing protein [Streptococcaceae bacterium]|jgi:hypothetical protein|nr:DUF4811 domain-containing protein [Streptococcaceae bacterium]
MIILLIIIFAALAIVGFFYMKGAAGNIVGGLTTILLLISMVGLIYHDTAHWGMKTETTTTTKQIYSIAGTQAAYGVMLKEPFGTDSGNYIFMYKSDANDKDVTVNFLGNLKKLDTSDKNASSSMKSWISNILKNHVVETSKKSSSIKLVDGNTAQIVTKTSRYAWSNGFAQWLFSVGGEGGELKKETFTAEVPKTTWLVLTQDQMTALQKKAPEMAAAEKAEMAANPEAALQAEALAKSDPTAYAALQVTQIKKAMGWN